uniref:NADAR domain-containing protein n=2 Tax=Meloidogyne floridensis TaxID=298350 RepID=A0A915PCA2_9BILA
MNSLTKFSFDSVREHSQQDSDINTDCDMRSTNQKQRSSEDIVHAAFPHKQEIVEEIKPKIKISSIFVLPSKKAKQEAIDAELEHLINPVVSSKSLPSVLNLNRPVVATTLERNKNPENAHIPPQNDAKLPSQDLKPAINLNLKCEGPLPQNIDKPSATEIEHLSDKDFRQVDNPVINLEFDIASIPLPDEIPGQNVPAYHYPNWRPPTPPLPEPEEEERHTESCSIENFNFPPPPPKFVSKSSIQGESLLNSQSEKPSNKRNLSISVAEPVTVSTFEFINNAPTTPVNSQTEKLPNQRNFQTSINETVTCQIQTPILPSWRLTSERQLQQDKLDESSEFKKPSFRKRLRSDTNEDINNKSNLTNTSKDAGSPSISDYIYPPKDMEEMVSKKNFFPSPTKTVNSSPDISSLTTSTKTTETPLNYRSGRFSFFTPKFNPLRYKNGWLFRHLCEKPALKNPAIKNSPIKNENGEEKKEGEEGGRINDSISSESNADLRCTNRIVPVIFSFNLTPIAPFFTSSYCFSNHYMVDYLKIDGQFFCCTEQYYMFYKAKVFNDRKAMSDIMRTRDPKFMKRIGSQVVGFDQSKWFKISIQVMAIATYYKYSLNRDLRLQLFETSGAEIIEVNPTDKRWGIGLPMDDWRIRDKNEWKWVKGTNILGRMLTMCRDKLLQNPKFSHDKNLMLKEIKESLDAARSVGCLVER